MNNLLDWMKSTRSIAVILIISGLIAGLFVGKITSENFMTIASIIITAYFAKRDTVGEQGGTTTSETTTTTEINK
jgi:hypothetical protein